VEDRIAAAASSTTTATSRMDGRNDAMEMEGGAAEGVSVVLRTIFGIAESSASNDTTDLPAPVPSPAGVYGVTTMAPDSLMCATAWYRICIFLLLCENSHTLRTYTCTCRCV